MNKGNREWIYKDEERKECRGSLHMDNNLTVQTQFIIILIRENVKTIATHTILLRAWNAQYFNHRRRSIAPQLRTRWESSSVDHTQLKGDLFSAKPKKDIET